MNGNSVPLVDLSPALSLILGAAASASLLLAWLAWRVRGQGAHRWLAALTGLTLFLTFDLIVFGSFTRLTDSGLGCPDWPGCYGSASPLGAHSEISAAQTALPSGPVTFTKAWIEMIHRYLAMTVGALILVMAIASLVHRKHLPHSPHWPWLTLLWVVVQGIFGKYTVTLKLYPAIVTLHLLGGMLLLALLTVQYLRWRAPAPWLPGGVSPRTRVLTRVTTAALWLQIALGGWVSTNYAVLACRGFPTCNGQWWPTMDLAAGFVLLRPLGERGAGLQGMIGFDALVGIHMVHRLFALVLLSLMGALAWSFWQERRQALAIQRLPAGCVSPWPTLVLLALGLWQLISGLSNVVLGWPLAAALAHSAGAAAMVAATTTLWLMTRHAEPATVSVPAGRAASRVADPIA
ncbi:MAG: COX15/CtaA family protein [Rubrivivax sp.]